MGNRYWLALGDSVTAGVGAPPGQGYVDRIHRMLEADEKHLDPVRICRSGWRCKNLARALGSPRAARFLREARLSTLLIGGNDLLFAWFKFLLFGHEAVFEQALYHFSFCYTEILRKLTGETAGPVYVFNLYNPFPEEPLANHYVSRINRLIETRSASFRVPVIDIHGIFAGREPWLIDGYRTGRLRDLLRSPRMPIHPGPSGHRAIADAFRKNIGKEQL
ncbi:SGNH/GDSL hydrolase family protein [Staphylospora marina]|uniref:SGNH/GDSL hydrolase family protein n=1 Tax=Staphylospora marina TaxID=2490858 RepID=UPI0013DDF709|nr:GDSL-type esterase/lipase family protein [Staphylospora marina]